MVTIVKLGKPVYAARTKPDGMWMSCRCLVSPHPPLSKIRVLTWALSLLGPAFHRYAVPPRYNFLTLPIMITG